MGDGVAGAIVKWACHGVARGHRRRARLVLGTALGLGAVVLAGTVLRLLIDDVGWPTLAIIGGVLAALLAVPPTLRRGRLDLAGAITSTAFLTVVIASGWSSGGLQAPVFLMLPAVPLLATFLVGPGAGLYSTSVLLVFVLVLAFLGPHPYGVPWRTSAPDDILARALMCGLSLLVVGFFAAATEQQRRRSVGQRRRSHGLYRRLFTQSRDVVAISTPDGQVVDVNPAGLELYGLLSEREAQAFDLRELYVDPNERDELRARLERDGIVRDFRCRHRALDGRELEVSVTVSAIKNADGEISHWLSTVRDLTQPASKPSESPPTATAGEPPLGVDGRI